MCLKVLIHGLVFVLLYLEDGKLEKKNNKRKSQKLPVFCHKIKTKA